MTKFARPKASKTGEPDAGKLHVHDFTRVPGNRRSYG